jgi:hypothetical protein
MTDWAKPDKMAAIAGATMEVVRLPGRTPADPHRDRRATLTNDDKDVLLYGHHRQAAGDDGLGRGHRVRGSR